MQTSTYGGPEEFRRVWSRVMAQREYDPIETLSVAQPKEQPTEAIAPERSPHPCSDGPMEAPPLTPEADGAPGEPNVLSPHLPARETPFTWEPARPVFAPIQAEEAQGPLPGAAGGLSLLREALDGLTRDAAACQALATRSNGRAAGELLSMARALSGHRRRLESAYFLLAGTRYPVRRPMPEPGYGLAEGLRRQYFREQRRWALCAGGAREEADPVLGELLAQVECACLARMHRLRALVEGLDGADMRENFHIK